MAQFSAVDAATEATDWLAGEVFSQTNFATQFGQSLEFQRQMHDHNGDDGDGGLIPVADPKSIWFYNVNEGVFS